MHSKSGFKGLNWGLYKTLRVEEKRAFSLRRKGRVLTPETLSRILGNTAIHKDAVETYEQLTGEKWPGDKEEEGDDVDV